MTRLSLIQRNLKRERLVNKYSKKRMALKKIIKNKKTSPEQRIDAINKLSKLPKNSMPCRLRNRCVLTGRPRGIYKKFRLSRIAFRELASEGKLPGITKSSW
ncbi:MAG: 30S ribosomal protein S14 [Alphaproteobacteria bacterium MarineAlpha6_Bin4]|nr:MAG: 30S ribosomal protein S14 [Alphaproteobacteria bacterium MarineAlpha6_Bin3]PPR38306.1 MAG: 30S ribosomal protein S14 [Alphaproteobacteria bacterium MarineAlpha6_Bin4]|tara:strand:+ start:18469 stop:18774 length:306 start_codon:yes stop_codon:yes gene_type:complete